MTITRRQTLATLAGTALVGSLAAPRIVRAQKPPQIAVVVKIGGIPWFNAMEVGIKKAAAEQHVDAWMIGPTQADAAQQVRAVEDLIARKVDVIGVVPNDAVALEPVFQRAKAAGIKVVTHESPDQKYNDWDIELTTAQGYGDAHMELLAKDMGEQGKYIVYVGSLTVPLHNKWADYAIALQKAEIPEDAARRRPLRRGREHGRQLSHDARPDARASRPEGHPDLRQPGSDRRRARAGGARQGEVHRAGRRLLAGAGREIRQERHHPRRLHLESDGGRRDHHPRQQHAGEGRGDRPTAWMLPEIGKVHVDAEKRLILAQKLEALDKANIGRLVAMGL